VIPFNPMARYLVQVMIPLCHVNRSSPHLHRKFSSKILIHEFIPIQTPEILMTMQLAPVRESEYFMMKSLTMVGKTRRELERQDFLTWTRNTPIDSLMIHLNCYLVMAWAEIESTKEHRSGFTAIVKGTNHKCDEFMIIFINGERLRPF
jgi:hypothetical protein